MLGCVKESEGPRVAGKTEENLKKMREGGGGGGGKGGVWEGGGTDGNWEMGRSAHRSRQCGEVGGLIVDTIHYTLCAMHYTNYALYSTMHYAGR